jgi:site-specific DNA-methyltransferase (adenine-specific)
MPTSNGASRPRLEIVFNSRQQMSGLTLLRHVSDRSAAMVVLDPQYRAVLDKLRYGNEGQQRERRRAALPSMTEHGIVRFIAEAQRVLRPSGHLLLWVDKFMIAEGRHLGLFMHAEDMVRVEMIHWNKLRIGMGRRARCQSEYLVIAQRKPVSASMWTDRRISDTWPETSDRSDHPHAKPHQLHDRLIRTLTKRGDLVIDPCAGGYGILDVCRLTGRKFLGCDLISENQT